VRSFALPSPNFLETRDVITIRSASTFTSRQVSANAARDWQNDIKFISRGDRRLDFNRIDRVIARHGRAAGSERPNVNPSSGGGGGGGGVRGRGELGDEERQMRGHAIRALINHTLARRDVKGARREVKPQERKRERERERLMKDYSNVSKVSAELNLVTCDRRDAAAAAVAGARLKRRSGIKASRRRASPTSGDE